MRNPTKAEVAETGSLAGLKAYDESGFEAEYDAAAEYERAEQLFEESDPNNLRMRFNQQISQLAKTESADYIVGRLSAMIGFALQAAHYAPITEDNMASYFGLKEAA
jgi:hypothetical protein